ncbi:MAG: Asp23/Gls24 family envelope stress response protein [Lachnospiraceae bacterium]|nr:Asp23/Gls24 family envelope stress response protein [Lachnospiraceae bacterium]MBR5766995.1 Asp23/Gls24 family envelope stress response protein [Lachnospiraceae bacterium]MBR6469202.1 Asp23/Gls24 family envelope stress response protein [Lachnospiraceae bacterium]MBR6485911.1 Asp23/Gls24 family envelope stress response protein [Lachnospiraceae bacterium]
MSRESDGIKNNNPGAYGEVRIADDVVGNIAAIAATEIDGVAGTVSNAPKEVLKKMGIRSRSKGVRVVIEDGAVTVDLALIMKYGFNIPVTSKQVQERVRTSVENMTGLTVLNVGIRIVGIDMTNEE